MCDHLDLACLGQGDHEFWWFSYEHHKRHMFRGETIREQLRRHLQLGFHDNLIAVLDDDDSLELLHQLAQNSVLIGELTSRLQIHRERRHCMVANQFILRTPPHFSEEDLRCMLRANEVNLARRHERRLTSDAHAALLLRIKSGTAVLRVATRTGRAIHVAMKADGNAPDASLLCKDGTMLDNDAAEASDSPCASESHGMEVDVSLFSEATSACRSDRAEDSIKTDDSALDMLEGKDSLCVNVTTNQCLLIPSPQEMRKLLFSHTTPRVCSKIGNSSVCSKTGKNHQDMHFSCRVVCPHGAPRGECVFIITLLESFARESSNRHGLEIFCVPVVLPWFHDLAEAEKLANAVLDPSLSLLQKKWRAVRFIVLGRGCRNQNCDMPLTMFVVGKDKVVSTAKKQAVTHLENAARKFLGTPLPT